MVNFDDDLTILSDVEIKRLIEKRTSAISKYGRVIHNGALVLLSVHRLREELDRRQIRYSNYKVALLKEKEIGKHKRKFDGEKDEYEKFLPRLREEAKDVEMEDMIDLTMKLSLNKSALKSLGKRPM